MDCLWKNAQETGNSICFQEEKRAIGNQGWDGDLLFTEYTFVSFEEFILNMDYFRTLKYNMTCWYLFDEVQIL